MIYQHPLAYLLGLEGLALLRSWGGEYDEAFVRARFEEAARLLADETLRAHPGEYVETDATGAAYAEWATGYDTADNGLLELDLPFIDAALDDVPAGRALDAACGTGRLARRLVERGHDVVGVDASEAMLEVARRAVPQACFVTGELEELPVDDASVDVLTNALALTHVSDLAAVMREFARVLRPGGTAIVTDAHPDLVFLGSAVAGTGPDGQALLASTHHHRVGDYLRSGLLAGLQLVRFDELPVPSEPGDDAPAAAVPSDVGPWRDWPWSLLDRAPAAARAAWRIPSITAWHWQRV